MSDIKLFRLTAGKASKSAVTEATAPKAAPRDRSFAEWRPLQPPQLTELLASLEDCVLSLGDDVQRKELRLYVAFKRLKNFATVVAKTKNPATRRSRPLVQPASRPGRTTRPANQQHAPPGLCFRPPGPR